MNKQMMNVAMQLASRAMTAPALYPVGTRDVSVLGGFDSEVGFPFTAFVPITEDNPEAKWTSDSLIVHYTTKKVIESHIKALQNILGQWDEFQEKHKADLGGVN